MTDRLTDEQIRTLARRLGYDQMDAWDDLDALVAEVCEHRAAIERVRALHHKSDENDPHTWCVMEDGKWPCDTIKALDTDQ